MTLCVYLLINRISFRNQVFLSFLSDSKWKIYELQFSSLTGEILRWSPLVFHQVYSEPFFSWPQALNYKEKNLEVPEEMQPWPSCESVRGVPPLSHWTRRLVAS